MITFHDTMAAHDAGSHWLPLDDIPDIGRLCFEEGVVIDASCKDEPDLSDLLAFTTPCIGEA